MKMNGSAIRSSAVLNPEVWLTCSSIWLAHCAKLLLEVGILISMLLSTKVSRKATNILYSTRVASTHTERPPII